MTTERATRDKVLDAFERLLVETGSRAATLDAVAARAGVSKGGLLYHFGSKDALVEGMVERLRAQAADDVEQMRSAPQGPVEFYLETSVDSGSDFDRALIAAARIAQENDHRAGSAMADIREGWFRVLHDHLDDEPLARTIQLIGDGLYFDDSSGFRDPQALAHVRAVLARLGL